MLALIEIILYTFIWTYLIMLFECIYLLMRGRFLTCIGTSMVKQKKICEIKTFWNEKQLVLSWCMYVPFWQMSLYNKNRWSVIFLCFFFYVLFTDLKMKVVSNSTGIFYPYFNVISDPIYVIISLFDTK